MKRGHYVVVIPVRNEEKFLQYTIDSLGAQTLVPLMVVVVDDGSTDRSFEIAQDAAKAFTWIQVVRRADRGFRKPGGGVVEAFYDGFRLVEALEWQFVVKLDGDLSFGPEFFDACLRRFDKDPSLGVGGATVCTQSAGTLVPEAPGDPAFHVRGATKIYRRKCWEALGGLMSAPGWDTVDEYKANMLGWTTYTFPEVKVLHHRPAGGAQGTWKNWVKNGLANYIAGYHPVFMVTKCVRRMFAWPCGVMAAGLLVGFFSGYVRRVPQVNDKSVIRYLREQQMRRLLCRESLWDRRPA